MGNQINNNEHLSMEISHSENNMQHSGGTPHSSNNMQHSGGGTPASKRELPKDLQAKLEDILSVR